MNIYTYDEFTKEYLTTIDADKDPEESKIKGEFVPLVPSNATIVLPPETAEDQTAVFEDGEWKVKPDYRKNYYKVNEQMIVEEIKDIGEQEGFYIVSKATGEEIKQNPDKFKIENGIIIEKSLEEYNQELADKEALRVANLSLTAADVERAIYKAFGKDFDDLIELVKTNTPDGIDIKALKIELKANNFYRGNPYISQIGALLNVTETQLDEFFETNDYTKLIGDD